MALIPNEELEELEQIAFKASPNTWKSQLEESVNPHEWFAECVAYRKEGRPIHIVGFDSDEDTMVTAITGNGPASEANATLYALSRDMILRLIEEVKEHRQNEKETNDE